MLAPEGTRHNSYIWRRLLRGIPYSQASPIRTITAWMRVGEYAAGILGLSSLLLPLLVCSREFSHPDKLSHRLGYRGPACLLARPLRLAYPCLSSTTLGVWGMVLTVTYRALREEYQALRPGPLDESPQRPRGGRWSECGGQHVTTHGNVIGQHNCA
jgi:hypothetical protein